MRTTYCVTMLLILAFLPTTAMAHHSMAGGADCGLYEFHAEQDMTKGRTDGLVYAVDHQVGCRHLILSGLSPAGRGEAQGNEGQMARCVRYGKEDAVNVFALYFDTTISPDDVKVSCQPWRGGD